ncbi:MAG: hypothetical protein HY278_03605 [candidate division NC10 bacterium]|nr:hypothetical protein [candidate division NC10 bacterium]
MRDAPRYRERAFGSLLCLLFILAGTVQSAAQIEATPIKAEEEALKGVKALRILVPKMGAGETTHGLTREAVDAHAQKTFQEKLHALKVDPKAIAVLYVNVSLADFQSRLGYYGNLTVELRRPSMILVGKDFPDSPIQEYRVTLATVWAESVIFTGEVFAPTAVRKALDGVLDRFIADFRKANP